MPNVTERQKINVVARAIAGVQGWEAPAHVDLVSHAERDDGNPRIIAFVAMAEAAIEALEELE